MPLKINKPKTDAAPSVVKTARTNHAGKKRNWVQLFNEWLDLKLAGDPIPLATWARTHEITPSHISFISSTQKWPEKVQQKIEDRNNAVHAELAEKSKAALVKLRLTMSGDEIQVRTRHCRIARDLQVKALARLSTIHPDMLKPSEAIELLKLGLAEERKALGLPEDYVSVDAKHTHIISREHEVFQEQVQRTQIVSGAMAKALVLLGGAKPAREPVTIEHQP